MPIRRAVIAVSLLSVLAGVSYAAFWWTVIRLPDPRQADRQGLLRWLVSRDLTQEPLEIRTILAERFDEEFRGGIDGQAIKSRLDPDRQARVWSNVLALLDPWYNRQVDRYLATPAASRGECLDEIIDTLEGWRQLDTIKPAAHSSAPPAAGLVAALFGEIKACRERATAERRQQMAEFETALETRWLLRRLFGAGFSGQ